jgi:hypothetical protein
MPIAYSDTVVLTPTVGALNQLSADTRDLSSTLLVASNTLTSYSETVVFYPTVGTLNQLSADIRDLSSTLLVSGATPTSYSSTVVYYPSFSNPVFTRVSTFISSSDEPIVISTANVANVVTQTWSLS